MQLEELRIGRSYTLGEVTDLHLGGVRPGKSYALGEVTDLHLGRVMHWEELHTRRSTLEVAH